MTPGETINEEDSVCTCGRGDEGRDSEHEPTCGIFVQQYEPPECTQHDWWRVGSGPSQCQLCGAECDHPNIEQEWTAGIGRTRFCPDCGSGW